jgi:VWFA-related protein
VLILALTCTLAQELRLEWPQPGSPATGECEVQWQAYGLNSPQQVRLYLDEVLVLELPGDAQSAVLDFGVGQAHLVRVEVLDGAGQWLSSPAVRTRAIRFDFEETSRIMLLPISLRSRSGKVPDDLAAQRFRVLEGGREVQVQSVFKENLPLDLVLLLDTSSSMKGAMADLQTAAQAFLGGLAEEEAVAMIQFHSQVRLLQGFSSDKELLGRHLANLQPRGETALFDALLAGLELLAGRGRGKRAIILFTDGRDSAYEEVAQQAALFRRVVAEAQKLELPLFTLGLGKTIQPEMLQALAQETGGHFLGVGNSRDLPAAFETLLQELRQQIILAVVPQASTPGFHSWQVKLRGFEVRHPLGHVVE